MSTEEKSPEDKFAAARNGSRDDALNQAGEGIPEGDAGQQETQEQETGPEADPDLEALEAQLREARDQTLRVQAEMQNLRRRVDRDIENAHKYALENFVGELLPVVDNLERGLATVAEATDAESEAQKAIREGVELTLKSFLDVLARNKVETLDPAGQPFDPRFHQAMTMAPHPEIAANTVIEVFQKGYLLNGRLVRPAMVVVSRGAEGQGET